MKKTPILIGIVAIFAIIGLSIHFLNQPSYGLTASYVPNEYINNPKKPYHQYIRIKGNVASVYEGGKEITGTVEKKPTCFEIQLGKEKITLAKEGGVYKDIDTKIEYGLSKEK